MCFCAFSLTAGGPGKEIAAKRDTVQAVVLYGEELLFDVVSNLSDDQVQYMRDSIMKHYGANELSNSLNLYLNFKNKSEEELVKYIDSVFIAGNIPYALINQINLFIANRPEEIAVAAPKSTYVGALEGEYPAQEFYPLWDVTNPNPYPIDLGATDTTLSLVLTNAGTFHAPVVNVMTSTYGWRDGRMHNGVDIDLQVWDPVVASFPGVVRVARAYGGYGRVVVIRHYNGLETFYAHLHRFKVKEGDKVEGGQIIGLGGSSGHSTGSHLHYEIRFKGSPINPCSFISFQDQALVNDTLVLKRTKNGYVSYPKGTLVHTVKKGDTLFDVAKMYGTTTSKVAELNGIRRNSYLYVGQRLRVI